MTRWVRLFVCAGALTAALASAACGLPFSIRTPADFAKVEEPPSPWQYRAVTAYGVALTVRTEENSGHASLAFWVEAVDRSLRKNPAYHPNGVTDVKSASGVAGKRLEYIFGAPETGNVYVLAVYATPAKVYVLETGGTKEAFARALPGVNDAIQSFSPQP